MGILYNTAYLRNIHDREEWFATYSQNALLAQILNLTYDELNQKTMFNQPLIGNQYGNSDRARHFARKLKLYRYAVAKMMLTTQGIKVPKECLDFMHMVLRQLNGIITYDDNTHRIVRSQVDVRQRPNKVLYDWWTTILPISDAGSFEYQYPILQDTISLQDLCDRIRCVIECPWHQPTHKFMQLPRQNRLDLIKIASSIEENGEFDQMPIIGDYLADLDFDQQTIDHCREPFHSYGCYVLDQLLLLPRN